MDMELWYFISGAVIVAIVWICICFYRVNEGPCPGWENRQEIRRQEQENVANQTHPSDNQVFVVQSGK